MNIFKSKKIIVIVGPTASGKSDLGIKLAKKLDGEIISADSRQVYRGMDVGTGKVLKDKTLPVPNSKFKNQNVKFRNKDFYSEGVRHHLIDVISPKKQFTADDFKRLGEKAIKEIAERDKIPIIVGGTGFYIDILLGRMATAQVPPNSKLRKHFDRLSAEHLFKILRKLDPLRAETIDRHNKRRLVRALEIAYFTKNSKNRKLYPIHDRNINTSVKKYKILWLGINPGKEALKKQIKNRLNERLKPSLDKTKAGEKGLIKEVEELHNPPTGKGVSWKRLDDFGLEYRWISRYMREVKSEKLNVKSFKESAYYKSLLRDIIRYSKRQMTWFKRNKEIKWFTLSGVEGLKNQKEAERLIKRFIYS